MEDLKMEQALRASELIVKHIKNDLTDEEQAELTAWINASSDNLRLFNELTSQVYMRHELEELDQIDVEAAQRRLHKELSAPPRRVFPVILRYAAAALVVLAVGASVYWYWKNAAATRDDGKPIFVQRTPADILPGSTKARLVLASGQVMQLDGSDSAFNTQGGSLVTVADGTVSYKSADNNEATYHTVIVPRGGQYAVWLDDGTRVWLNSASSLHYPSKFTGDERTVKLTGEGYFQVAENKAKPFHVTVNDLDVKVTGTEFNINSYNDEAVVRSTLFKGAVHITGDRISFDLKPGKQLQTDVNGNAKIVDADLEATASWRNGVFSMSGADLPTIMRQIARWYDLDQIVYPANFDTKSFHISGTIPKSAKLDEVLEALAASGAQFRLDGKKLILLTR